MSLARIEERIEMLFEMWSRVGPRNCMLGGQPDPPWERAIWGASFGMQSHGSKWSMGPLQSEGGVLLFLTSPVR